LARKVLGDLQNKRVGVVGTGEMGELATQHLLKAGASGFQFFNRGMEGAERLAATYGGKASQLSALEAGLAECDIVISATGSPEIVIQASQVRQAMRKRHGAPLFLIDIAAPRDIDPDVGEIDGTFLFTIDDLKAVVAGNLAQREQEAQKALAIVDEEAERIDLWVHSLAVVPLLKEMRERTLEQAESEARKWGAGKSPEEQEQLMALARGLANKFLHTPTAGLKRLGEMGDGARANYYASQLFGLESSQEK
jgi:glutamyl-tRNA reductase